VATPPLTQKKGAIKSTQISLF